MISLKRFDIFKAPATDLVESSAGGGALTISAVLVCLLILCSELGSYWRGWTKESVFLHQTDMTDMVSVTMDISILDYDCKHVSLDIQDSRGRFEVDVMGEELTKEMDHGSCRFHGRIYVHKIGGNFHFSPRSSKTNLTMDHQITDLRFGDLISGELEVEWDKHLPMQAFDKLVAREKVSERGKTHDYFIKLVKTEIFDADKDDHMYPFQYTYTHRLFQGHHKGKPTPPRIYFRFDFSPLTMKFTRKHLSFYIFLTRHLAFLGGVLAVTKMIYGTFYAAQDNLKKLGKLN